MTNEAAEATGSRTDEAPSLEASEVSTASLASPGDRLVGLMMRLRRHTLDEVSATLEALAAINRDLLARSLPPVSLSLLSEAPGLVLRLPRGSRELGVEVQVDSAIWDPDVWLRDHGIPGWRYSVDPPGPRATFFHTGRLRLKAMITRAIARMGGLDRVRVHGKIRQGDFGGNVLVTPDQRLLVGTGASAEFLEFFRTRGYRGRIHEVDVGWLWTRHLDEVFAVLPDLEHPGRNLLVRADPRQALDALRAFPEPEWRRQLGAMAENALAWATRFPETVLLQDEEELRTEMDLLHLVREATSGRYGSLPDQTGQEVDGARILRRNELAADQLDALERHLVAGLVADGSVPPRVVRLPVVFRGSPSDGRSVSLVASPANLVAIDRHILLSDPFLPVLREAIALGLGEAGYRVHFVPSLTWTADSGGIRCATQEVRVREAAGSNP